MFKEHVKRLTAFCISSVLVCSVALVSVSAESALDVYSLYGFTYNGQPVLSADNLQALEDSYDSKVLQLGQKQMLKDVTGTAIPECQTQLEQLDLNMYQANCRSEQLEEQIENSADKSTTEILTLVSLYRQVTDELAEFAEEREILTNQFSYLKEVPSVTETETKNVEALKEQIDIGNQDLGDVKNVRHPLNNTYCITSEFGYRVDPISLNKISFHSGLDMRASVKTEVLAIFAGKVEKVTKTYGGGNTIWIDHGNGIKSVYMHLYSTGVSEGQMVKQYDVIALSGNTGANTTGPHLHFGLYINNTPVDPAKLF